MESVAQNGSTHNGHSLPKHLAWKQEHQAQHTPVWIRSEPPFQHCLKWTDPELHIEHLLVIRSESADALWAEVRKVIGMIKTARGKQQPPSAPPAPVVQSIPLPEAGADPAWYSMHQAHMQSHKWGCYSHKTAAGTWCKGISTQQRKSGRGLPSPFRPQER